ncbi:hypothetical protein Hypma_008506 [Hypsizygus marmoreus]|uniref:Uncharacterized protein n=1 Tax=Hypsizygus marmoreus TaxID=39966 RepID=A0A369JV23_HYPMA|nr:hypothetical protein Hypma_008506 [Hypsizygus marmoreus]
MVQKNVALAAAAAFVIGMSSVSAAPMAGNDNELYARADKKIPPLTPGAYGAISRLTGPKDPAFINAVVGKKGSPSKKTRDLSDFEDELFARAFEEELYARADKVVKGVLKGGVTQKDKPLTPGAYGAISRLSGPKDPAFINAVVGKKGSPSKKTRDLSDFEDELFARALEEEELYARADKIGKVFLKGAGHLAKDAGAGSVVDAVNDKLKSVTQKQTQPLNPVAAGHINAITSPLNPGLVNAVIGGKKPSSSKKTRDLSSFDDELFTRALEEELYARGWLGLEDLD